jgi:hypothetical protein
MDNTLTVEKVFSGRLLRVPDYQRGYAWEKKNWTDFLDDLDLLPPGKQHYTGTLVLNRSRVETADDGEGAPKVEEDRTGATYEVFDVVDGQQRLTTIVMLLDAIRRELEALPGHSDLAIGIETAYIQTVRPNGEALYRLELGRDLNDFWRGAILNDGAPSGPETAAQARLLEARTFFADYLSRQHQVLGEGYADWLRDLQNRVKTRLLFVPYEVSSSAEVGVIFEVMNDRGKSLTELEKAKNYLLYLSEKLPRSELGKLVNAAWAGIFEDLMAGGLSDSGSEDQLLRAHWLAAYNADRRSWDGTGSVKKLLSLRTFHGKEPELLDTAFTYVRGLRAAAIHYRDILAPQLPSAFSSITDPAARRLAVDATRRLLRVRAMAAFLPLLMAVRLRYPSDADHFVAVAELCEKFGFRVYRLHGRYSNSGQSSLFSLAREINGAKRDQPGTVSRLEDLIRWYSRPKDYTSALSAGAREDWYRWYGLKYLLYAWEEQLSGPKGARVAWDLLEARDKERTIEHVLPQTPADDSEWVRLFTDDQRRLLTHTLGNLVLTEDNSAYGRKVFLDKRGTVGAVGPDGLPIRCYANSKLTQEQLLAGLPDWTPERIHAREEQILTWARGRWAVPDTAVVEDVVDDEGPDEP